MKLIHDIQPDNMFFGLGKSIAQLNFMTTGLVYTKKIDVRYIPDQEYIEVNKFDEEHHCDFRDYPEVCEECYENHMDGYKQFKEDEYREQDNDW